MPTPLRQPRPSAKRSRGRKPYRQGRTRPSRGKPRAGDGSRAWTRDMRSPAFPAPSPVASASPPEALRSGKELRPRAERAPARDSASPEDAVARTRRRAHLFVASSQATGNDGTSATRRQRRYAEQSGARSEQEQGWR